MDSAFSPIGNIPHVCSAPHLTRMTIGTNGRSPSVATLCASSLLKQRTSHGSAARVVVAPEFSAVRHARAQRARADVARFAREGRFSAAALSATAALLEDRGESGSVVNLKSAGGGSGRKPAARVAVVDGLVSFVILPSAPSSAASYHDRFVYNASLMQMSAFAPELQAAVDAHPQLLRGKSAEFLVSLRDEPSLCDAGRGGTRADVGAPLLHWNRARNCADHALLFPGYDYVWANQNFSAGSCWRADAQGPPPPWGGRVKTAVFRGSNDQAPQRHALLERADQCRSGAANVARRTARADEAAATLGGDAPQLDKDEEKLQDFVNCAVWPLGSDPPPGAHMSAAEQQRFAYALDLDGQVSTLRFKNLLLGGWLVLKPASPNEQYFHADLAPDEHYVPLRADLSDLQAQVARARANDAWAHEVAVRGAAFARAHLGLDAAMEYQAHVIAAIADAQRGQPVVPLPCPAPRLRHGSPSVDPLELHACTVLPGGALPPLLPPWTLRADSGAPTRHWERYLAAQPKCAGVGGKGDMESSKVPQAAAAGRPSNPFRNPFIDRSFPNDEGEPESVKP